MTEVDWVSGDTTKLRIPVHAGSLREGGAAFLTEAFRASGVLGEGNRVTAITELRDCLGGSTGRKLFLGVAYERSAQGLDRELFVKFSRDFDDPVRDRGKNQMESEVHFGALSRAPNFPIDVPACFFADYHHESGSGLLITERVNFGEGAVEPHHEKCLDYLIADPLEHYRVIIASLATLSGTHKAGALGADIDAIFPYDAEKAIAADPIRYDDAQLQRRIDRYAEFAENFPQLLPQAICTPDFIHRLHRDVPFILANETELKRRLHTAQDYIALCHWNANIDNAWFWRSEGGGLHCGLMDWGRVGQMNVAMALWGVLSAAERSMLDAHLDDLFERFATGYRKHGGPVITVNELKMHFSVYIALMTLGWLMDGPALIKRQVGDLTGISGRTDPRIEDDEIARTQLHMMTNAFGLWQRLDFGAMARRFLQ